MLTTRRQITLNGESTITVDGSEITVATMFASLGDTGKFNNNTTIINKNAYLEHVNEVDADIAEFNTKAANLIKGV